MAEKKLRWFDKVSGDGDVEENTLPNMDLKLKLEGSIDSIVHVGLLFNW